MLANKLMSALSGAEEKLYVDDVFSTYLYTGNGATQTINNGIDLAGKGGLVWVKGRSGSLSNVLIDTFRGVNNVLSTDTTNAAFSLANSISAFSSSGFSIGSSNLTGASTTPYASWTFRKAPKFFDVVVFQGNGTANQRISHGLGIAPGLIVIKASEAAMTDSWFAYQHDLGRGKYLVLNSTSAAGNSADLWGTANPTVNDFGVSTGIVSTNKAYVAYLFAHDPSADGIVQCGSFTTSASNAFTTTLGWEPQYVLFKSSNSADDWRIVDSFRGFTAGANQQLLSANTSAAEVTNTLFALTATGFAAPTGVSNLPASTTYIYLAIRRPNKPPTTGTEVYGSVATIGSSTYDIHLPSLSCLDLIISQKSKQSGVTYNAAGWNDRLRGFPGDMSGSTNVSNPGLSSASSAPEGTGTEPNTSNYLSGVSMNRAVYNGGWNGYAGVFHAFRRAPGFFDVVCYTGTGVARTVPHSLGVAPELMIVKSRSAAISWVTYDSFTGATNRMLLDSTAATGVVYANWNNTAPTSSVFTVGTGSGVNGSAENLVAYLFASLPGISKVGSYTGNGTTQTINCGFTTGARFILIKRTDSAGDWYVWDTARGIISANDPHLSLNTSAAEVTSDDSVDPDNSGFIVNQNAATNINVSASSYIFLSIA